MKKFLVLWFVYPLFSQEPGIHDAFLLRSTAYASDIVICAHDEPFLVSYEVTRFAQRRYKTLTESILFYPPFLKQTELVRAFLQSPHHFNGKLNRVDTIDGEEICYTFFDRGSKKLIVVGGGFMNQERVASVVQMFNDYDVVIFNHRGIEYEKSSLFSPRTWDYLLPSVCVFEGLNGKKITFGEKEDGDVSAVVYDVLKKKTYEKVFGIAFCYSAPIFIKAAVVNPGLFSKLILDGAWVNSDTMINSYLDIGKKLRLPEWLRKTLFWCEEKISGIDLRSSKIDFSPYLQNLRIPVLFIHSANDNLVSNEELHALYAQIPAEEKAVVLTTNGHTKNHLKCSCFYKYLAENFFYLPYREFVKAQRIPYFVPEQGNKLFLEPEEEATDDFICFCNH